MDNSIPPDDTPLKRCSKPECHKWLPATTEFFTRDRDRPDGLYPQCKECRRVYMHAKYLAKHPDAYIPPVEEGYKWCPKCKQPQPLTEFSPRKVNKDGLHSYCQSCNSEYLKQWREDHPEYEQEYRPPYMEAHQDRIVQRRKQHYQEHGEAIREQSKLYYETHTEQARDYLSRYAQSPHGRLVRRAHNRKRKAQIVTTTVEAIDYQHILDRYGYWCYICCKDIDPTIKNGPASLQFDHVIPLRPKLGEPQGTHTEDNLKPCHKVCNNRKRNRRFEDLTPYQRRGI